MSAEWWLDGFFSEMSARVRSGEIPYIRYSEKDIEESRTVLLKILDNEWFAGQCTKIRRWKVKRRYVSTDVTAGDVLSRIGHVFPEVAFNKLITLGRNIKSIGAENLPSSLVTMIRNPREFHKAYVEIEVASSLVRNGLPVELHPTIDGVPDIRMSINGKDIYIEVTVLEWFTEAQKALDKLTRPLFEDMPDGLTGKIWLKRFPTPKNIQKILQEIRCRIKEPTITFELDHARVSMRKVKAGAGRGIMVSVPPSTDVHIGSTYMKRILKKYRRLPKGAVDVVVADLPIFLDPDGIREMVSEAQRGFRFGKHRIAGIITTHKLSEVHGIYLGLKASPLLFIVNSTEKAVLDRLASSLSSF